MSSSLFAIALLPVFYPYVLGHLAPPLSAVVAIGAAGGILLAYHRTRAKTMFGRILRAGLTGYALVFAACTLFGSAAAISRADWNRWHRGGAGLRAGMTTTEVIGALSARARDVRCGKDGCSFSPKGLAGRSFTLMDVNGVHLHYGPDGRLQSWNAWSD